MAVDLALACVKAVEHYGDYSGPVDRLWLAANVHEDLLLELGSHVFVRSVLSQADLGNW